MKEKEARLLREKKLQQHEEELSTRELEGLTREIELQQQEMHERAYVGLEQGRTRIESTVGESIS